MLGISGDQFVNLRRMIDRAAHQVGDERVALRLFFGIEDVIVSVQGGIGGLPAVVPQEQDLQRALPGSAAGSHQGACRRVRRRFAISMAVIAASKPLLPPLAPARSMACSRVLVVSTPNATGMPVSIETCAIPFAASPAT